MKANILLFSTFVVGYARLQGEAAQKLHQRKNVIERKLMVDPCVTEDIDECGDTVSFNGNGADTKEQTAEESVQTEAVDSNSFAPRKYFSSPPKLASDGKVMLTGENSVVELSGPSGNTTTLAAHWRAQFSSVGPGHALFIQSDDLTGGKVRAFTDNKELLGLIQELELLMRPQFGDASIEAEHCDFSRSEMKDVSEGYSEYVQCYGEKYSLTWFQDKDREPFFITLEPNVIFPQWGVWSNIIPAGSASVDKEETKSGSTTSASGEVLDSELVGRPSKASFIAWGETWVKDS